MPEIEFLHRGVALSAALTPDTHDGYGVDLETVVFIWDEHGKLSSLH